jgi:hypothetical protein
MSTSLNFFEGASLESDPRFEFLFEIRLRFTRVQNIDTMPSGAGRGAVYIDSGEITGPRLNGKAVPNSGGDYALFRPDDVLELDARYMLEAGDGTLIMLYNRGYIWGREEGTMQRIRDWIFNDGPPVAHADYYFRCHPTFEVAAGKYDWLTRHVIIGIGERKKDGNLVRYFALT